MKTIYIFSTINLWLQDANEIPESTGIVFLYIPGRDVCDFILCATARKMRLRNFLEVATHLTVMDSIKKVFFCIQITI